MKIRLLLVSIFIISGAVFASQDGKVLAAKDKVFPALVHIQPIKEIFADGEKRNMQITGSGVIFRSDGLRRSCG